MIYFIRAEGASVVKVGHSVSPVKRLQSMRTWSPVPLELVAFDKSGDYLTEAEFMFRHESFRSHGEWFHHVGPVAACVEETRLTGTLPGGWYIPTVYKKTGVYKGASSTPTLKDIESVFGISRVEILKFFGDNAATNSYGGVPLGWIPRLVSILAQRGQAVTYHDIFASLGAYANLRVAV